MSQQFYAGFESDDFSEWDSATTGSELTTGAGAALGGSSYGCNYMPHGSDNCSQSVSVSGTTTRVGFRFDKNTLAVTGVVGADGVQCIDLVGTTYANLFSLRFRNNGGTLTAIAVFFEDDATEHEIAAAVPAGATTIELRFRQATNASSADGFGELFIGGGSQGQATGLDNYDAAADASGLNLSTAALGSDTASGTAYLDEIYMRDDDTPIYGDGPYDLELSSGGNARDAIAVSADGAAIFLALQYASANTQVIFKVARPTNGSPTVTRVYNPNAGGAANVAPTPDSDKMIFFGNFGTDAGVILHAITAGTNTDRSPSSIGSDKIQPLKCNPGNADHWKAINKDDQDAIETDDSGATWTTLNAAIAVDAEAADWLFSGVYFPDRAFVGGDDGVDKALLYTPNDFSSTRDDADANLKAASAVLGIDMVSD